MSGPGVGSDGGHALERFSDMSSTLPPFLARNISLMNYERPTPIQKHAVSKIPAVDPQVNPYR